MLISVKVFINRWLKANLVFMIRLIKLVFILLLGSFTSVLAQNLKGVVKDEQTRFPIVNAQIITPKIIILTNNEGEFVLGNVKLGDRIAIRILGYETLELTIHKLIDTLRVYLRQDAITLNEVQIRAKRNYKLDSLTIRKEYANAFAYKGPSFSDMFIGRDPNYDSPFGFTNPRSTASLVSLNVLQVVSLFGKKKSQTTRLKETLLRDEELNYVDHVFSKEKIKSITDLDGDELIRFMDLYRPSILSLKKMTGYELTLYIKKCYKEFIKVKVQNH